MTQCMNAFRILWRFILCLPLCGNGLMLNKLLHIIFHPLTCPSAGAGCCDVISDTDVNAIKIMAEVCNNILRSQSGKIDSKMEQALASGKLTAEIISTCRHEVNKTCGVDIALFLDHNIRLGKTYRQILDDVRSYNSSNCLKMNYGVAPWSLGVPHLVGKYSFKTMSQFYFIALFSDFNSTACLFNFAILY